MIYFPFRFVNCFVSANNDEVVTLNIAKRTLHAIKYAQGFVVLCFIAFV